MTSAPVGSAKESELRQRAAAKAGGPKPASTTDAKASAAAPPASSVLSSVVDAFRVLAGMALVFTVASYAATGGKSFTWGINDPASRPSWLAIPDGLGSVLKENVLDPEVLIPDVLKPDAPKQGVQLTNEQLAHYDGSDGAPIYLALNRTIYDVSASPNVYGPGGPYSQLAAKDASRSYITTCFDPIEDLVPYFGGAEEVFVPLWLSKTATPEQLDSIDAGEAIAGMKTGALIEQIKKKLGKKNMRLLTDEVYEQAQERVRAVVSNWEAMFAKKGYPAIGKVVGVDEEDPLKWRHLTFCEEALKQRPALTDSMVRAMELSGRDPGKIDINAMGGNKKGQKKNKNKNKQQQKAESQDIKDKGSAKIEDLRAGGKYADGSNVQ